jgi:hypothetical protein|tara:strand:+ start:502 stop:780 length:279 start_codon:yes stop_codon:yes gene_type:complete
MSWFNLTKKDNVDDAIDDLEEIAENYDLEEHDWSSVDDASDYLFEHKVKKILEKPRYNEQEIKRKIESFSMSDISRRIAQELVGGLRETMAN